jgi:hypothetical protein
MNWRKKIENVSPDTLIEVPDIGVYIANRAFFTSKGYDDTVFAITYPLLEQQIWSIFQLFSLVKSTGKNAHVLEIGSGRGGSMATMYMANKSANFTNIDKFAPFDETSAHGTFKDYQGFTYIDFRKNLIPFKGIKLKTILKWSDEAVSDVLDKSQDLIFIDGNHTYENCKADILNYQGKVKDGGILCGHDYHPRFPGVIKAVKELFGDKYEVLDNSSIWVKK